MDVDNFLLFFVFFFQRQQPDIVCFPAHKAPSEKRVQLTTEAKHNSDTVHHNLSITLLLGSKTETVLVKQLCHIQTKIHRLYRKMTIYGLFVYTIYTFSESIFKPCYIQNTVIMNSVIKRFVCSLPSRYIHSPYTFMSPSSNFDLLNLKKHIL